MSDIKFDETILEKFKPTEEEIIEKLAWSIIRTKTVEGIIKWILANEGKEFKVLDIAKQLLLPKSTVKIHLDYLEILGIITSKKMKAKIYSLNKKDMLIKVLEKSENLKKIKWI
jgi:predicted transcriptional regulator